VNTSLRVFCSNNLHIVLCMSPVGSAFRSRCRMFPSLVNCCTIDWFIEWPREALLSVSKTAFAPVDFGKEELKVTGYIISNKKRTAVAKQADRTAYDERYSCRTQAPKIRSHYNIIILYKSNQSINQRFFKVARVAIAISKSTIIIVSNVRCWEMTVETRMSLAVGERLQ